MAGWRVENKRKRELLADLASELRLAPGPACRPRPRPRLTWQLRPYLSVRTAHRRTLRVYCAGADGRYVLLTGCGQVIGLDKGVAAAAAAAAGSEPGESAARRAAAVQPGS